MCRKICIITICGFYTGLKSLISSVGNQDIYPGTASNYNVEHFYNNISIPDSQIIGVFSPQHKFRVSNTPFTENKSFSLMFSGEYSAGEKLKIPSSTLDDHRMPILNEETALFAFA